MGLFDRVESRLERAVNGAFAKAFKSEVEPVEIAAAIRRAMDDRAAVVAQGRTIVPNHFNIELSDTDYDRLAEMEDVLSDELIASAQEHVETQRYSLGGPLEVDFCAESDLETGVFRLRSSTKRATRESVGRTPAPAPRREQEPRQREVSPRPAPPAPPVARPVAPVPAGPVEPFDPTRPAESPEAFEFFEEPTRRAPAPARPAAPPPTRTVNIADRPWLDIDGERYPLLGPITVIGRDDTADIVLDDPGVSRRHSEIRVTNDGPHIVATIRDLQSTNGTYVEGNRITSEHLDDGNRLTVGRTSVTYRVRRR